MKRYYGKFPNAKTWHVICADNMEDARKKMVYGTTYSKTSVIMRDKKPNTKYPIAGIKTQKC